ncbi:hypothetical protein EDD18DRAFT_64960 [Armillaria luteobubalina]|uniref:Uncharacterized protein n=1 Tax=Armillaria luteobubalina TaxID=153913 RepID=A0AA39TS71_9AGAR|nr:hypothetical protein EDD18DRAFT_64960 [Armillaria luteobubalina]
MRSSTTNSYVTIEVLSSNRLSSHLARRICAPLGVRFTGISILVLLVAHRSKEEEKIAASSLRIPPIQTSLLPSLEIWFSCLSPALCRAIHAGPQALCSCRAKVVASSTISRRMMNGARGLVQSQSPSKMDFNVRTPVPNPHSSGHTTRERAFGCR